MLTTAALALTLYACEFQGGPLWSAGGPVFKGYIAPNEASADVSPTIRLEEEKIASAAYAGQVWGFVSAEGKAGMVLSIFAPGVEEAVATQVFSDLEDPLATPYVYVMQRTHGVDYYHLTCTPASFEPAK